MYDAATNRPANPAGVAAPQAAGGFLHTNDSPLPEQYRTPMVRRTVKVGAPIGVLIALGVVVLAWLVFFVVMDPAAAGLGAILATVAIGVVVALYLWLDRWEPEPPRLLIFAFLWGAALCTLIALVVNTTVELLFGPGLSAVFSAPFIEELAKGGFLLLMLTGRRRKELTSLTDCLIYAGLTAAGFAWTEDILYLVQNADSFGVVAVMRLVFSPFAHPLFTSVTAIGVYYSMRQRSGGAKAGLIIAGFAGAMFLHALWNAAPAFLGGLGFIAVYVILMIPAFAGGIVLAIFSRRRERQLVVRHLPGLVETQEITMAQAAALETMAGRKAARDQVLAASSNPDAKRTFNNFTDAVTELAFVRDRFDRGLTDPRLGQLHQTLRESVRHARSAEPAIDSITAPANRPTARPYPPGQGAQPGQPRPGWTPPPGHPQGQQGLPPQGGPHPPQGGPPPQSGPPQQGWQQQQPPQQGWQQPPQQGWQQPPPGPPPGR